jgi:sugar phosphate isomerase/epimerase
MVAANFVAAPFAAIASGRLDSTVKGVALGAQSYSFRDRPTIDGVIEGLTGAGLSRCELWQGHVETREAIDAPRGSSGREALRKWRLTAPMTVFTGIREKFRRAGITLTAYNLSFTDGFTDEEIARGFDMAAALGVKVITSSSNISTVKRIDPIAERRKMPVGLHNHSDIKPNEFATAANFASALAGTSKWMAINFDIGHFTAAGGDALAYLDAHHDRIVSLHIKDWAKQARDFVPFGTGEAPVAAVLKRLRDRKWKIPANIEYEYKGNDTIAEVRRCYDYCRDALLKP